MFEIDQQHRFYSLTSLMKEGLATGCQDPPGEDRPVSSGRRSAGGQLVDARGRLEDCGVTVLGDDDDEQLRGNTNLLGTSNRGGNQWFGAGVQRTSQTSPEPSPGAGQTGSLVKTRDEVFTEPRRRY